MKQKKSNKILKWSLSIIFFISLFLFLLSFSIAMPVLNRWFYFVQIKTLNISEISGYSYNDIVYSYNKLLDYLTFPWASFDLGVFKYSQEGKEHFQDTKVLFMIDLSILIVTSIICLVFVIVNWRIKNKFLVKVLNKSIGFWVSIISLILILLIVFLVSLDFEKAFIIFHKIFFKGKDNWVFDPTVDPIIKILPEQFFLNSFIFIAVVYLFSHLVIISKEVVLLKKRKNKVQKAA
ncbi:TIGR01906 family membrane protein [Malacoplasma iowae]|uniref:TIGR01906 family membrane protein n=1 Tax=Malacoplasma iowae TaxID=2116 RepID=UPI003872D6FB|nr:TIGR01906 family membrane protein [Malacoplasma iowae]